MITNSLVYNKACAFAIQIVKAYRYLNENKEYILSKQLLRCGTSVGANITEANGAIPVQIFSQKEYRLYGILETKYWLSLLKDTDYLSMTV
ncbi:MAG: four helix bundle protein [Prevotella sp.]|jgi:four helix bundle protein|nr:four helix bundle protein [Prevotella sp.]